MVKSLKIAIINLLNILVHDTGHRKSSKKSETEN